MNFHSLCIIVIAISVVAIIAMFLYLKFKKQLNEKAFVYGVLGAVLTMFCSTFVMSTGDIFFLIIDGLFMAMVFYNITTMFGIRLAKIDQDTNAFRSFFSGISIVGNFLNVLMLGAGGLIMEAYAADPVVIEALTKEVLDALMNAYQVTLMQYGYLLIVSVIVAIAVGYIALSMFVYANNNKTIKTIGKGILILSAFYIVNLYSPTTQKEGLIAFVIYLSIAAAAYLLYQQSKEDKPSIEIIIK